MTETEKKREPVVRPVMLTNLHNIKWWEKFTELEAIWLAGSDPNVFLSHPTLGIWLNIQQRSAYKAGKLEAKRIHAMEAIGVKWVIRLSWDEMVDGLKVIAAQNGGDPNVPQIHPTHGTWLSTQRVAYNAGRLAADRTQALEAIGVKWQMPKGPRRD
jgi:hypothetical protein